jgi:uncharacterized protein (TIGR03435 family)
MSQSTSKVRAFMKIFRFAVVVLLGSAASVLLAQAPASTKDQAGPNEPLIVDVHASLYRSTIYSRTNLGMQRLDMRDATILDLITSAYRLEDKAVVGGPPWIDFDRFDVAARIDSLKPPSQNTGPTDPGTSSANSYDQVVRPFLKQVLKDRFHLVYHAEDRPQPGYVVTVAKGGAKLTEAQDPTAPAHCQGAQDKANPGQYTLTCTSQTVAQFLSLYGREFLPHPAIDRTGLTKLYDFTFKFDGSQGRTQDDFVRLFVDVFNKQLGLVATPGDVPQPAMIIDKVDRTPTPNLPDIAKLIPALPELEFEVASIRLSAPNEPQWQVRPTGTQITFTGFTARDLVVKAWQLATAAMIANAPPGINDVKYTVLVKLPPEIDGRAIYQNQDQMNSMLQNLVIDRFHLKYHWGDQTQVGYVLLADNPKMKKADPNSRSYCKDGPPDGEKDLRTLPDTSFDREFHCQNVTMAQFADRIQPFTNSEVKNRVPDKTELTGGYDFTLFYTTNSTLQKQTTAAADAAKEIGDGTPEPVSGVGLEYAFRKQLGLRLEKQQGTYPAFIIDSMEPAPTEN